MIIAFKHVGVELTPEELYDIVEGEKFDLFFDFIMDAEEEASFDIDNMFSPDVKSIELTKEQEDKLMSKLVMKEGDADGDIHLLDMTEEELMKYLLEGVAPASDQNEQPEEWTAEDKKLMRFIQRLK